MSRRTALLAAITSSAAIAIAQQPAPAFAPANLTDAGVRAMAANCAACHGTQGRTVTGSAVAALAGRPAARISEKMRAYREGRAEATVMHQIAKGYSDAEIAALAAYFAGQKP